MYSQYLNEQCFCLLFIWKRDLFIAAFSNFPPYYGLNCLCTVKKIILGCSAKKAVYCYRCPASRVSWSMNLLEQT